MSACITDCMMVRDATKGKDPSNPEKHQSRLHILKCFTGLCCFFWVFKLIVSFIEPYAGRDIEQMSDFLSLLTLWIGEIPKTVYHLFFVCNHGHKHHRNCICWITLLSICKLGERFWGIGMKYDWRTDVHYEFYTISYIVGVITKFVLSLIHCCCPWTVVQIIGAQYSSSLDAQWRWEEQQANITGFTQSYSHCVERREISNFQFSETENSNVRI